MNGSAELKEPTHLSIFTKRTQSYLVFSLVKLRKQPKLWLADELSDTQLDGTGGSQEAHAFQQAYL